VTSERSIEQIGADLLDDRVVTLVAITPFDSPGDQPGGQGLVLGREPGVDDLATSASKIHVRDASS
jgi:hypothetical protein